MNVRGSSLRRLHDRFTRSRRLSRYQRGGRIPWSQGYIDFRRGFLMETLHNHALMARFRAGDELPEGFGTRLDERVVEYPWLFSRLSADREMMLDAGSVLNFEFLLELPILENKTIVIYTLEPEGVVSKASVSYIYGDLRQTILRDNLFDVIVCISTLEHVGMDNTMLYAQSARFHEARPSDYREVITELKRMLRPAGTLFLTVPYGKYENHGWLQQFDANMMDDVIRLFDPAEFEAVYFKYSEKGWNRASADDCATTAYFDIHHQKTFDPDYAAAARAVACLELRSGG